MKHIKNFGTFINESESGYYPPGAEHDPRAPYNQDNDGEHYRENDWIDSKSGKEKAMFSLLAMDSDIAILKHKETGETYVAYIAGDEIEPYMPKTEYREYIGRDEDGDPDYETEYQDEELDDLGVIAMATDLLPEAGEGLADYQDGKALVKMDDDLKADLLADYSSWLEKGGKMAGTYKSILQAIESPIH